MQNKTNIIFLDIDGVLNTWRFQDYQVKCFECDSWNAQFNFDPICMKNLKELIDKTNAYIVISSSWRNTDNGIKDICNNLKLYGLENRFFSCTPILDRKTRGEEIEMWLYMFSNMDINYVILDDDNDVEDLEYRLVQCNDYYGFTKNELEKALELFRRNEVVKIEIVFKETNMEHGVKKNDIFTYEKHKNNIKTFANGVQIVDDFEKEDYSNGEFLSNLINGLNLIGTSYEILKIEL